MQKDLIQNIPMAQQWSNEYKMEDNNDFYHPVTMMKNGMGKNLELPILPPESQQYQEGTLDRSFEDLVSKILATEEDCQSGDSLATQLTLTQELLDNLSMGNCFENGVPPWKQASIPDISGLSSTQLIQEALNWMQQNRNLQEEGPYPIEKYADKNFCKSPPVPVLSVEDGSIYSGIGSPRSSIAGSYSSGDEVGWSQFSLPRNDPDATLQSMTPNSSQLGSSTAEYSQEAFHFMDGKPQQRGYERPPHIRNTPSPKGESGYPMPSNKASPMQVREATGMFSHQNLASKINFNNRANSINRSPRLYESPSAGNIHTMHGQPGKVTQMGEYVPAIQPPFAHPREMELSKNAAVQQWKNQQDYFRANKNPRPQFDSKMAAGFPRNTYNRIPYSSRPSHVPGWVKRNQPPHLNFQQQPIFANNYSSLPNSPVSPSPVVFVGELASAIEECQYQLQNLEKERRKTETDLVKMYPGKRISSSNTIAVPPLPPNPSPMDQLIVEEYREHSRMTTLLSKIGGLNARALHPNIEVCLDKWMSAIQLVEAHRTAEMCQGRKVPDIADGPIVEKIIVLSQATRAARTKLWCALQLSKEKLIQPIKRELINFIPDNVRLI